MKLKAKIYQNKGSGQKLITIPKYCDLEAGDEVLIERALLVEEFEKCKN